MTAAEQNQRVRALATCGGHCEVCGKPLTNSNWQGAHRIANTKANRQKYGDLVIDHWMNIAIVCSLKCNDACNIGNKPRDAMSLAWKIYCFEISKMGEEK